MINKVILIEKCYTHIRGVVDKLGDFIVGNIFVKLVSVDDIVTAGGVGNVGKGHEGVMLAIVGAIFTALEAIT